MRIGEAAREVGVATHVLRHWEDAEVVVTPRSSSGHREYDEELLARLRVVRACQGVGMSLAEIRLILSRSETGRVEVIARRLAQIREQRELLADAQRFLEHVVDCRHDLLTRCGDCSRYAAMNATANATVSSVARGMVRP